MGFNKVYDLGGLQFMDGMIMSKGEWNRRMPPCAGGGLWDGSSESESDCSYVWVLLAVGGVVAVGALVGAYVFMQQSAVTEAEADVAPGVITAYPAEAEMVDIEKIK